jgi:hypothetical protein
MDGVSANARIESDRAFRQICLSPASGGSSQGCRMPVGKRFRAARCVNKVDTFVDIIAFTALGFHSAR